jgi:ribonuclease Z
MSIDVTLLGTGSPMPDPNRAGPATLVSASGEHLLVDAGRGVLMRLAAAGLGAGNLSAVLLTHLHSDHFTDLNDVITTRWVMTFEPTPLTIIGPVGTQAVVDHILASLGPDISYRIAHHEDLPYPPPVSVVEVSDGPVELGGGFAISCAPGCWTRSTTTRRPRRRPRPPNGVGWRR